MLADFRAWLQQAAASPAPPPDEPEPIDLHTLLGQFVALKHEINLLTKAARTQQEQNAETLRQLGQAVDALKRAEPSEERDDEKLRPLLKSLLDVADALGLARREVRRVQEAAATLISQTGGPAKAPAAPFWSRWFTKRQAAGPNREAAVEQIQQFLESVITGYTMSLQRVERALQQHELEPIPATGEPFDPERMEVVEAVAASGRPAGEVIEEVRRGYLWRGRVFRYAQVSVAKREA